MAANEYDESCEEMRGELADASAELAGAEAWSSVKDAAEHFPYADEDVDGEGEGEEECEEDEEGQEEEEGQEDEEGQEYEEGEEGEEYEDGQEDEEGQECEAGQEDEEGHEYVEGEEDEEAGEYEEGEECEEFYDYEADPDAEAEEAEEYEEDAEAEEDEEDEEDDEDEEDEEDEEYDEDHPDSHDLASEWSIEYIRKLTCFNSRLHKRCGGFMNEMKARLQGNDEPLAERTETEEDLLSGNASELEGGANDLATKAANKDAHFDTDAFQAGIRIPSALDTATGKTFSKLTFWQDTDEEIYDNAMQHWRESEIEEEYTSAERIDERSSTYCFALARSSVSSRWYVVGLVDDWDQDC